uniref:Luc7-like protein 3 n=1 Tax=Lotharella globosa TaxID=91324 RepID=A0A6U2Y012_9EUKA
MDAARALLDSLMGAERNAALEDREKYRRKFTDRTVCKHFLCGLCPYQMLDQTKSDVGEHKGGKEHDLRCKQEWESLSPEERKEYGFEYDLLEWLERLVRECDERIAASKRRIEEKEQEKPPEKKLNPEEQEKVLKLTVEMDELVAKAEALGEQGEVDKAMLVTTQVNGIKQQIKDITQPIQLLPNTDRQLVVCEVSGNLLCSTDTEDRKARHYAGRHYQGWMKIRAKLEELKETVGPRPPDWRPKRDDRGRDADRDRRRDRDRDRERDRDRDRDRHRRERRRRDRSDSPRDRRRRRDRSRDRDRRRSRERRRR